jgi:hypothetical protein
METMNILQYFNEHASKEDWDVVQKVYNREFVDCLEDLGMQGKEAFNLAELAVIYTRVALEKDLEHVVTIDHEIGCANNESAKEMYMDVMKDVWEEYEEEDNE